MQTSYTKTVLLLSLTLLAFVGCAQPATTTPIVYAFGNTPIWQDEFDYSGKPDPKKWGYDLGDHGWGNNELENYTDRLENARVESGNLIIEAIKEKSGKRDYSSARLVSKGKGDFLFGKFEIKAKLPKGLGTWPAIWMLATDNAYGNKSWPDNGEIDIMEHVGFDQDRIHGNIHTKAFNHSIGTNKGNNMVVTNASEDFHIYGCAWTPDYIAISVDGKEYFRFLKDSSYKWEQWPFDKPFHFLLNVAVGGNWGGQKGLDDSVFPQKMTVDYIRVFPLIQKK